MISNRNAVQEKVMTDEAHKYALGEDRRVRAATRVPVPCGTSLDRDTS
jgi:hypothetical protein